MHELSLNGLQVNHFNMLLGVSFSSLIDDKSIGSETFILGGILFKSELGIAGHSDGDALLHALTDSILGALALGDIGTYFPSDNPSFKNKNSDFFLLDTINKMNSQNFKVNNTDITVILQKPTVQPYINDIKNMPIKTNGGKINVNFNFTNKIYNDIYLSGNVCLVFQGDF